MTTLRDRLENHLCQTEVGGDLSPGQIAEVVDIVLAFLAAEPVSDEAMSAYHVTYCENGGPHLDSRREATTAAWRAMPGVKP